MAFDKNQLLIHQLQVKSRRLEDGLKRLIELYESNRPQGLNEDKYYDYYYALGCAGGDFLKKKLFETQYFEQVVLELKENKFMKSETADKNIEAWRAVYCGAPVEREGVLPRDVSEPASEPGAVKPTEKDSSSSIQTDRKGAILGELDENGDVVPREAKTSCEYADPAPCEDKCGGRKTFGGGGGSESQRRILECY